MGDLNLAVTGFHATTSEQNFEVTSQRFFNRSFKAYGAELEASYRIGQFSFSGGTTYTDAQIKNDQITPANDGNTPRRQAAWISQGTATRSEERRVGKGCGLTDKYRGLP